MKTMFKKNGKRVLSAALCLLMAVMSLPLSAFAWTSEEGRSCTSSFGDYYVGLDGEYYRSQATMHTLVYNDDGSTYVKSYSSGNAKRKYLMTDNSGTHQVYCVESGIDFNTGNTYTSKSGQNSSYFKNLPTDAQFGVMMALMYGWHEGKSSPVAGTNADDYAYATQSIIWEYQQQLRTSPADLHSAKGTMDKASPEVRKYIAQRAELLGAIRLPDNTFRANAGTEVTSDILILQKRDRVIDTEPDWIHLDTDENGVTMNSYFVEHPEMVLGNMVMESTRFGKMDVACNSSRYDDVNYIIKTIDESDYLSR